MSDQETVLLYDSWKQLLHDIKKELEASNQSAVASWEEWTLTFTVLGDTYEYDFRQCGDFVALDGVVMIPDAELIAHRIIATRADKDEHG